MRKFNRYSRVICLVVCLLCLCLLTACDPEVMTPTGTTGTTAGTTGATISSERFQNVSIAGVDLTGLTKEEAVEALTAAADAYATKALTVQVLDSQVMIDPAECGISLNVEAAADAAFRWNQEGNTGSFDLVPYLSLDEIAIRGKLDELTAKYPAELTNSGYELVGEMPSLKAADKDEPCQTLRLTIGTPGYDLNQDALYQQVMEAYSSNTFFINPEVAMTEPAALNLDSIYMETYIAPVDAVKSSSGKITAETYGYEFDIEAANKAVAEASYGDVIEIAMKRVTPAVTSASLTESAGDSAFPDVLASYRTAHSKNADRTTNLKLACKAINGMILQPGQTFDYNKALGERTEAKGYKGADGYMNGLTVTSIGGGICQVSSTLYYCTLLADLEIVTRRAHSFVSSYMPIGTDATVSWGGPDFRFKNDTNHPIKIQASVSGGYVSVKLLGTDEKDYYIKMTSEVLETYDYEVVYQEYPANNKEGYKDGEVIITPYTGYKVKSYKNYYDKDTGKLIKTVFEANSNYKARNKVICKIVGSEKDPEPTKPTTPPATEPTTKPTTRPTTPPTTAPTTPPTTAPTTPPTTEPTAPPTTEPTAPPTTEPTAPPTTEPTAPPTAAPTEPEETQPEETEAPTQSDTTIDDPAGVVGGGIQ